MYLNNNTNDISVDILKILADMPQSLRFSMLRQKIQEFLQYDHDLKFMTTLSALSALQNLDRAKAITLINSWLSELLSFNNDEIQKIIEYYIRTIQSDPLLLQNIQPEILIESFNELENQKKDKIYILINENLFLMPNKEKFVSLIPKELIKLMHSYRH